jgi:hypothetical protein
VVSRRRDQDDADQGKQREELVVHLRQYSPTLANVVLKARDRL